MGDPKRTKKKYEKPRHPWQKARIEEESALVKEYGLKNRKEIWKMKSFLTRYLDQAKKLIAATSEQSKKEEKQMLAKLNKCGLLSSGAGIDDTLNLTLRDILERRLQTQVYKKGLARSMSQARQFIVHQHITVKGTKISSPSYMVATDEEGQIGFADLSRLNNAEHPERQIISESDAKKERKKRGKEARDEKKGRGWRGSARRESKNRAAQNKGGYRGRREYKKPEGKKE